MKTEKPSQIYYMGFAVLESPTRKRNIINLIV